MVVFSVGFLGFHCRLCEICLCCCDLDVWFCVGYAVDFGIVGVLFDNFRFVCGMGFCCVVCGLFCLISCVCF